MKNHAGYPFKVTGKTKYVLKTSKLVPTEGGKFTLGLENGDLAMITGPEAVAQTLEHAILKAKPADVDAAEAALKAEASSNDNVEEVSSVSSEDDGGEMVFEFVAVGYGKYRKRIKLAGPVGSYDVEKV